jgi:lambda repressor-like predicted transcriptional regulator
MHPADIKASLTKAGIPPSKVARRLGLAQAHISNVINSRVKSARVARCIAEITGYSVSKLWPDAYPRLELEELKRRKAA